MKTIVIVGGSLAGVRSAQALRTAGFDGRLVLLGEEDHRPYDRPPLSKAFLEGRQDEADIALLDDDDLRRVALDRMEGYTNDEIAARLGCARRTVARRLDVIRQTWEAEVAY